MLGISFLQTKGTSPFKKLKFLINFRKEEFDRKGGGRNLDTMTIGIKGFLKTTLLIPLINVTFQICFLFTVINKVINK
jgi:hypothetical protein